MHSTTSAGTKRLDLGFNEKTLRGAGIRVYEYASSTTIKQARLQLEALYWLSKNSINTAAMQGMSKYDAAHRHDAIIERASDNLLLDETKLKTARIIGQDSITICPLCLEQINAEDFFEKEKQASGRETWDHYEIGRASCRERV